MPAYFSMNIQFRRKELYPGFVHDFYEHLDHAGLKFHSGYWEGKRDSYEQITTWNQERLEQDFVLGYSQHVKHDYRQIVYSDKRFTEIRGFWLNRYPERDCFCYEIIIPDEDVIPTEEKDTLRFDQDKIEYLLDIAKKIALFPSVEAIQTALELDVVSSLTELEKENDPCTRPFAIVKGNVFSDGSI